MFGIDWPTIVSNRAVIPAYLCALDVATVASPTDRLQVIQIKEQLQIAFVRFKVVYDRTARMIPTRLQMCTAAAVLASVFVPCKCLSPECLPMFGAEQRAVCLCFYTPISAHFMLHIVYC